MSRADPVVISHFTARSVNSLYDSFLTAVTDLTST